MGIQRTGQITLLILARCQDGLLLARQHPVRSDLGVQMNVHLILVNGNLVRAQTPDEPSNLPQPRKTQSLFPKRWGEADLMKSWS